MKRRLSAMLMFGMLSMTVACSSSIPNELNNDSATTNDSGQAENENPIFSGAEGTNEEEANEEEQLALWPLQIGESSEDFGQEVVVDDEGNVYVVGFTNGNLDPERPRQTLPGNINHDILIIKFDSDGHELWRRQTGGRGDDLATSASLDEEGNLYIAGTTSDEFEGRPFRGGRVDLFVQKYSPAGELLWTSGLNTTATDELVAIEHFKESLIVLARSLSDITLIRMNESDGRYDSRVDLFEDTGSSAADTITNLTIDQANGEIYIVGWTPGELPWYVDGRAQDLNGRARYWQNVSGEDAFVMRIDPDFFILDTVTVPTTKTSRLYDVALDDDRNLYVVGETTDDGLNDPANTRPAVNRHGFILKLNERFGREWLRQPSRNLYELSYRVDLAPNGDVIVAGYESDPLNSDVSLTRFDSETGLEIFNRPFGSPVLDNIRDLAIDPDGNVFLLGVTQGTVVENGRADTAADYDWFLLRIDENADLI